MCANHASRGQIYVDEIPKDPYKFRDEVRARFMKALAETGRIYHAADVAGVSVSYIYQRRKIDEVLDAEIEAAMGRYRDAVEAEIHRRAIEGVVEKKYHQGLPILDYELDENGAPVLDENGKPKIVGQAMVRRYSDQLLLAHARKHIPEYNERRSMDVAVSGLEGLLAEIGSSTGLPSEDEPTDE